MTSLGTDGYVVLDAVLDAGALAQVRASVADALARGGDGGPTGTAHADDLGGAAVEALRTAPRLRAAVEQVLGAGVRCTGVHFRGPNPGYGGQALHADFAGLPPAGGAAVAVAIVALVDIAEDGGATRVVPGTHTWQKPAPRDTVGRRYPGELRIPLAAGSALVLNGHLWHSGTRNDSSVRRDALQVTFSRRAR